MAKKSRPSIIRPLAPDVLGRAGQSDFGGLCDKGRLVANNSERVDRMGWDYIVEFPLPHQRGDAPFDSRPKFPDMKIQIKTIWSDRTTVDVELPAAERLARWDYPSFIVIMRMNMDMTYKDIYVIHLLDDNLARILKALRKAEDEGSLSIKKKTVSFGIQHGTRITEDGEVLAHTLRSAIGEDPNAYMARKSSQLRSLGFEAQRYTMTFSITAADESEILDVFLGLQPAQTSCIEVAEVRFGLARPQIREADGILEIKPGSLGVCEFVLTSSVGDRKRAIFEAELYVACPTMTPSGPWKVRIHSPLIEVLYARDDPDANFTIAARSRTRHTLNDIIRVWQAKLIVASGRGTAVARMNGKKLLSFNIRDIPSLANQREAAARIKFLTDLDRMLCSLDVRDIKLNDADITSNIGSIQFVLQSQRATNGIAISLKVRRREDGPGISDTTEGLFASAITFPGLTIVFWASMRVTATPEEDRITLHLTDFSLRDIAVLATCQTFDEFVVEASEMSGLRLIIKTENVNWPGSTEPEVAETDENNTTLVA